MLLLRDRVDQGAMAMKEYSAFPNCSLNIILFNVISGHSFWESYPSEEMKSVYSTLLADWASLLYSFK